jgi:hypothetical protein
MSITLSIERAVQIPGVTDKSNSLLRKYNSKYSAMKN